MQSLKDLRVVELATVLAGPSVGTFLAELGATVIKVEHPDRPDVTRSWKLPSEAPSTSISAYFASANAGKEYIQLDWKSTQDQHVLLEMLGTADVLLTNFRDFSRCPGVLQPAAFTLRNPRLIYCQLDGYSSTPGRAAYDVVLQAETGYTAMNGTPESGPTKLPLAFMDLNAAHQMKQAILLALYEREKTGKGALIRCSLERAALANLANQAANWLMGNHVPRPTGSLHPNIAPYGETFTCVDGQLLVLAIGSNAQFAGLLEVLGLNLAGDPRFATNADRVVHRTALADLLTPVFAQETAAHWSQLFQAKAIPAGQVRSMDQVFASDYAQSLLWEEDIDGQPTVRPTTVGFSVSGLATPVS